jgi:hypothetical protein
VVVAGIYTAWLAIKSNDGLVTDDYYKKGLAANQTIARNELATRLGWWPGSELPSDRLSVRLAGIDKELPHAANPLAVTVSHPTRAGLDQSRIMLTRNGRIIRARFGFPPPDIGWCCWKTRPRPGA